MTRVADGRVAVRSSPAWPAGIGLLFAALLMAACGPATTATPPITAGPTASPAVELPASPVDGVIIAVDATSLSDVRGFTLLLADGRRISFTLGALENPTEFPPGHLKEHMATSEPIRVYFRVQDGVPVVYRLGDAAAVSPAAT
jgi:hypothetical protein